jgi:hypothetical protein
VADDGLIVQRLEGEWLVYDTASNEAHVLGGAAAAEFDAAIDEVSRREVIRRMALAGAATSGTAVRVKSIVAPAPAQAASICGGLCSAGADCAGVAGCTCCCQGAGPAVCSNSASCTVVVQGICLA